MAQYISYGLGGYILIGIIFSFYFITRGIRNESLGGRGIILRLLLIPGAALLWPILLRSKSWSAPTVKLMPLSGLFFHSPLLLLYGSLLIFMGASHEPWFRARSVEPSKIRLWWHFAPSDFHLPCELYNFRLKGALSRYDDIDDTRFWGLRDCSTAYCLDHRAIGAALRSLQTALI